MDCFVLCWMYDKRWLFSLQNPCFECVLTIPISLNIITVALILMERKLNGIGFSYDPISLLVLLGVLAISELVILIKIYHTARGKVSQVNPENYEAINLFVHERYAQICILANRKRLFGDGLE